MTNISSKPAADAPGVLTSEPAESRPGLSTKANPGFDVVAFSLSRIWAAAKDLDGRAWDETNHVLTDDGGGGARTIASSDNDEIVMTARAPAFSSPSS